MRSVLLALRLKALLSVVLYGAITLSPSANPNQLHTFNAAFNSAQAVWLLDYDGNYI